MRIDWDSVEDWARSDRQIARELGCTRSAVAAARRRRGEEPTPDPRAPRGIDWDSVELGAVPDAELARRLDVAPTAVGAARRRRGIPPCKPSPRHRRSARVAAPFELEEVRTTPELEELLSDVGFMDLGDW